MMHACHRLLTILLHHRLRDCCRMLRRLRLQLALRPVIAATSSSSACIHSSGNTVAEVLAAARMPLTRQSS